MKLKLWNKKDKPVKPPEPTPKSDSAASDSGDGGKKPGFIKSIFLKLNEKQRQRAGIVLAGGAFILFVVGIVKMQEVWQEHSRAKTKQAAKENKSAASKQKMSLLSDRVERELWVAAEGQNIKAIEKGQADLRAEMTVIQEKMEKALKSAKANEQAILAGPKAPPPGKNRAGKDQKVPMPPVPVPGTAMNQGVTVVGDLPGAKAASPSKVQIRIIEDDYRGKDDKADHSKNKKKEKEGWLPTGSFMKAVLLNGIDAPTSGGAQSEPYPVLMSVQDIATLPNRFRMDMRECFLIGAGYGNISDERAYIRTERLSCIRKNGEVVDFDLTGHIIGEDGKLGIRGRLVSKQGQQVAMSIFAGTLAGLGSALKPTGTVKLDIGSTETTSIQRNSVGDVMTSAGIGGAGSAMERVAQHYLKMAEKMFPIIEIDAGRSVEVVILKGRSLSLASQNSANNEQPTSTPSRSKNETAKQ